MGPGYFGFKIQYRWGTITPNRLIWENLIWLTKLLGILNTLKSILVEKNVIVSLVF